MTAVTAVLIEKVLRKGCAVLYTETTSTIACKLTPLPFLGVGGGGGRDGSGGLGGRGGSTRLGFTRLKVNQVRVGKV